VYLFRRAETALGRAPAVGWLLAAANWAGPVLVGIALLAALYKLLPNTKVRYRAAVGGAVIAVPLWLAAKWAFGLYLTEVVGAGSLYGALGLLPLFLIWLNTSWLIFLFGGELAHTAANLRRLRSAERAQRTVAGPWDLLAAALAVAGPYVAGRGPADVTSVAGRLGLPAETARRLLEALTRLGVVCPVESPEEAYVPARPVADVKVADVLAAAARDGAAGGDYDPALARAVKAARERAAGALGELTLADALQANLPTSQGSICTETSGEPS